MAKNALITGSSSGIGKFILLKLAQEGWNVGVHYAHSAARAEAVAQEARSFGVKAEIYGADAADTAAMKNMVRSFVEDFGSIDLLVNNVGVTILRSFLDVTEELFDQIVNINVKACYFTTQEAAKAMIAGGVRGNIINITSVQQQTCFPDASLYGSLKAALAKLTTHLTVELAPHGIRVNAVAPGTIETEDRVMTPRFEYLQSRIPMGRLGKPEEIAATVAFLVSGQADFIQGANIVIDGGAMAPSFIDNLYTPRVVTDKLG